MRRVMMQRMGNPEERKKSRVSTRRTRRQKRRMMMQMQPRLSVVCQCVRKDHFLVVVVVVVVVVVARKWTSDFVQHSYRYQWMMMKRTKGLGQIARRKAVIKLLMSRLKRPNVKQWHQQNRQEEEEVGQDPEQQQQQEQQNDDDGSLISIALLNEDVDHAHDRDGEIEKMKKKYVERIDDCEQTMMRRMIHYHQEQTLQNQNPKWNRS